jgi:drug/metabolite transporter (DMT)-like permease
LPAGSGGDAGVSSRRGPLALGALLLGAVAIGSSAIWVRLSEVGPVATAFWRTGLAVPFLALWALSERRPVAPGPKAGLGGLAAAGAFFAGDLAFWHVSILLTSVATSTLLANLAPIFVTLAGWLWLKERVDGKFVLGLAVALAGVSMLIAPDFQGGARALAGDAFGMVTALFYAAYLLQIKRLRARISTARIMAASSLVTAAIVLPVAWLLGESLLPGTPRGWGVVLGLALVSHVAGQSLIAYALAHLPASLGSVSLLIQPIFASLFAWLVLGEAIGPLQIAGGIAALTGIGIAHRASASVRPPARISA